MHTPDTDDKAPAQKGVLTRPQAFKVARMLEAAQRGQRNYSAIEFRAEFGNGVSQAHLYHTLYLGEAWSRVMVDRVDAFIYRHLPDWTPPAETKRPCFGAVA